MGRASSGNVKLVVFEVDAGAGIERYEVRINGNPLAFHGHRASAYVPSGEPFELLASSMGQAGSQIILRYVAGGVSNVALDEKIPFDGVLLSARQLLLNEN